MNLFKRDLHLFKVLGNDGLDLLNRISTNFCASIEEGKSVSTILLDDKGKIIDLLYLFYCDGDLYMICHFDSKSLSWIDRFVFTEDIAFEKQEIVIFEDVASYDLNIINKFQVLTAREYRLNDFKGRSFIIDFENKLTAGQDIKFYSNYRIQNLLADFHYEINEKTIPLEIGFIDAISFNKGCYTGQEVIARLESMHKVTKYLARICSDEAVDIPENTALYSESGQQVGKVSTVSSDKKSFLGIIHKSKIEKDSKLFVGNNKIQVYVDLALTTKTYQNI